MKTLGAFVLGALLPVSAASAQEFTATVLDRQNSESQYSYVVPGRVQSRSAGLLNCDTAGGSVSCLGTTSGGAVVTPPRQIAYSVMGATLTLGLPDGRVVVVNCDSKYALRFDHINRRSCRVPFADHVSVTFSGDAAKLSWSVSLDGRKVQSETYKILGVIDAEPASPKPTATVEPERTQQETAPLYQAAEPTQTAVSPALEALPQARSRGPKQVDPVAGPSFSGLAKVVVKFVTPVKYPNRMDSIVLVQNLEDLPLRRFLIEVTYRTVGRDGELGEEIAAIGSMEVPELPPGRQLTLRIPHRVVQGLTIQRPVISAKHIGGGVTIVEPTD